jgi:hypothetical protein
MPLRPWKIAKRLRGSQLKYSYLGDLAMSRIEELGNLYDKSLAEKKSYQRLCEDFAGDLLNKLADYLDWTDIRPFPPSKDFDPDGRTRFSHVGAMEWEDDGFWRMGLAIMLPSRNASLLVIFLFKHLDSKFIVKIENTTKEFSLEGSTAESLEPVFNFIFDTAKNIYEKGFQDFLRQRYSSQIGFRTASY